MVCWSQAQSPLPVVVPPLVQQERQVQQVQQVQPVQQVKVVDKEEKVGEGRRMLSKDFFRDGGKRVEFINSGKVR